MSAQEKYPYYPAEQPVPETPDPGSAPKPWGKTTVVGKRQPRVDGYELVSGRAVYPSDISLPGMLSAAVLRSPHPNAVVKSVDTRAAEQMPGVHAILTGSSPEANLWWSYANDVKSKLFDSRCRFEGEAIAAVAAETSYQAWDALKAIKVEYDVLPPLVDELKSLQAGAPLVHDGGNRVAPPVRYKRGDVEKGFAEADVVLEQSYRTECEIHTPLERHGCVAEWNRDRLTLWQSTQGVYRIQSQLVRDPGAAPVEGARHRSIHGGRIREQTRGGQGNRHRGAPGEENGAAGETLPDAGKRPMSPRETARRRTCA